MTIEELSTLLALCLVVCNLGYLLFVVVPDYRVRIYQQRMYSLRDLVFQCAADGYIGFSDGAYVSLMHRIDVLIEHADQITFFRIVCTLIEQSVMGKDTVAVDSEELWHQQLLCVRSDEAKAKLIFLEEKIWEASSKHLVRGSIVLLAVVFVVACWRVFTSQLRGFRYAWRQACGIVLSGPIAPPKIEQYALCLSM